MAESVEQPSRDSHSGQKQHEAVPNPLGGADNALHNWFEQKLRTERETGNEPGARTPDPVITPPRDEGQPAPREPQHTPEPRSNDDIPKTGGQPEAPAEQPNAEDNPQDPAPTPGEDNPQDPIEGLDIDGKRYTADEVRSLIEEAANGGLRLDDYRRKTQFLSRVRQEHEALGSKLEETSAALTAREELIDRVLNGTLQQYENVDTSQLSPEQFQQFRTQWSQTKANVEAIRKAFGAAEEDLKSKRKEAFDKRSASTYQMIRWHEPRWDDANEFYGKLRSFAVSDGLMTEEAFDQENDFLRLVGIISLMDKATLPEAIVERVENPKPPQRQRERQQQRNDSGRFTSGVDSTRSAVLSSTNAKADGSLRNHFLAKMQAEARERGR